jgi:hypothetical protein
LDRKWTNIIIWPRDRASISVQQLRIDILRTIVVCSSRNDKAYTTSYLSMGQ